MSHIYSYSSSPLSFVKSANERNTSARPCINASRLDRRAGSSHITSTSSNRLSPGRRHAHARAVDELSQVGDARGDGVEAVERGLRRVGDDSGEGCLADAWGSVKDSGGEPVGFYLAPEKLALPEDLLLADKLVERARRHPPRQRRALFSFTFLRLFKKVQRGPDLLSPQIARNDYSIRINILRRMR